MKVSGFTIVRNAVHFDYPVLESIASALPVCDEFLVSVGNSKDGTLELIQSLGSPKIRIVESKWDDSLRAGGRVLAIETDKAFRHISQDADWAFYLQADEVLHEKDYHALTESMQAHLTNPRVEGLLFDYLHFYGSYDFIGDSRRWYRREVRVIRNHPAMQSFRDAQGFRRNGKLLRVKPAGATIHHYGWVRKPEVQMLRQRQFHRLWHDDQWLEKNIPPAESFDYHEIDSLARFCGTHPAAMHDRIRRINWDFAFDPTRKNFGLKNALLHWLEKQTGWRPFEYKNYRPV